MEAPRGKRQDQLTRNGQSVFALLSEYNSSHRGLPNEWVWLGATETGSATRPPGSLVGPLEPVSTSIKWGCGGINQDPAGST